MSQSQLKSRQPLDKNARVLGAEVKVLQQLERARALDRFQIAGLTGLSPMLVKIALHFLEERGSVLNQPMGKVRRFSLARH